MPRWDMLPIVTSELSSSTRVDGKLRRKYSIEGGGVGKSFRGELADTNVTCISLLSLYFVTYHSYEVSRLVLRMDVW